MKKRKNKFDLASRLKNPDDCWIWPNGKSKAGYGMFGLDLKTHYAHRGAYALFVDGIPWHLELDHKCRNRACFNPLHLEAVTHRVNLIRGDCNKERKAKPNCVRGHPLDRVDNRGSRVCSQCHAIRNKAYRERVKNAQW